jgi:hypothetical protein
LLAHTLVGAQHGRDLRRVALLPGPSGLGVVWTSSRQACRPVVNKWADPRSARQGHGEWFTVYFFSVTCTPWHSSFHSGDTFETGQSQPVRCWHLFPKSYTVGLGSGFASRGKGAFAIFECRRLPTQQ